ncbi:hypothetical protein F1880_009680 [Penicillium rolfsii]|nr:hypothetical protein F1880_009680 [Penicillium rolfsii]
MGFLYIREPRTSRAVPGTVVLEETQGIEQPSSLKHARGSNGRILLNPQPDDNPNNPLNFSQAKKITMMGVTSFGVVIFGGTLPSMLNAGLVPIAQDLDTTVAKVVQANGYQLLVVAAMVLVVNAFARKWGKQPVFLFSSLIGVIGSIVGSTATSYEQLLAARVIQGFSSSAYESLCLAMVHDLFFVHERGLYTAIVSFLLGGVSNFSAVICGPITANLGWRYLFHFLIAFGGLQVILQFLLVPETQYCAPDELPQVPLAGKTEGADVKAETVEDVGLAQSDLLSQESFIQRLALWSGPYSSQNFFLLLVSPLFACMNLAVLWVILVSGYFLSIYVATAFLLSPILSAPPYFLTASGVGYMSLGPFLGGLIAATIAGLANDPIARLCAHRNNGVYEPEYRLIIGCLAIATIPGFVGFGHVVETHQSLYLAAFLHGLGLFGIMFALISTANYALDSFGEMSNEIFLCSMAVKNLIIFSYSYFVNDWALRVGPAEVMWILCTIAGGLFLTFPLWFIYGKLYRASWKPTH